VYKDLQDQASKNINILSKVHNSGLYLGLR